MIVFFALHNFNPYVKVSLYRHLKNIPQNIPHRILILCYTVLMTRKKYEHSAYYYAYHYGWTYSEALTFAGKYLDEHTYRPRMRQHTDREWSSKAWFKWRNATKEFDSKLNPFIFSGCVAVDLANAMRDTVRQLADPIECDRMKRELMRDLRRVRRPFYYAQEVERRRALALERRKIRRRRTMAPMPTPEVLLKAWNERKSSRKAMVLLGGIMHDLECYVDNCLRFDEAGNVVGRNGGIRGWLKENVPELFPKYKTLMRYKALAVRLRQVTDTEDPKPTSKLLEKPLHKAVATILADEEAVFARVFSSVEHMLSPSTVMLDAPKGREATRRRRKT